MRARTWGVYDAMKRDYLEDEFDKESEKCVACGACAAHCPQHIDIPARLREAREYFTR